MNPEETLVVDTVSAMRPAITVRELSKDDRERLDSAIGRSSLRPWPLFPWSLPVSRTFSVSDRVWWDGGGW